MRHNMKRLFLYFACSATLIFPGRAADAIAPRVEPAVSDGWTFSVTPYFWAAGLSGETSSFWLPVVDIDADFSDVLDNLDFAAMAIVDARYSRFSIFGDFIYTSCRRADRSRITRSNRHSGFPEAGKRDS